MESRKIVLDKNCRAHFILIANAKNSCTVLPKFREKMLPKFGQAKALVHRFDWSPRQAENLLLLRFLLEERLKILISSGVRAWSKIRNLSLAIYYKLE